jgi:hypothetical protein
VNRIRDVTMAHLLIPKISKVRKCCADQLNSPEQNRHRYSLTFVGERDVVAEVRADVAPRQASGRLLTRTDAFAICVDK